MTLENEFINESTRNFLRENVFHAKNFVLQFELDESNLNQVKDEEGFAVVKIPIKSNIILDIDKNISGSKTDKLFVKNNILEFYIPKSKVLFENNISIDISKVKKELDNYFFSLRSQVQLVVESYQSVNG